MRHPSNSHIHKGRYLQFKYAVSIPEKISICLNSGRAESLGNDDVSMLNNTARPQGRNGWDDVKQKIPKGTA